MQFLVGGAQVDGMERRRHAIIALGILLAGLALCFRSRSVPRRHSMRTRGMECQPRVLQGLDSVTGTDARWVSLAGHRIRLTSI
jgi:hypothetical protein